MLLLLSIQSKIGKGFISSDNSLNLKHANKSVFKVIGRLNEIPHQLSFLRNYTCTCQGHFE